MKKFFSPFIFMGILLFASACSCIEDGTPTFSDRQKVFEHFVKVTSKNDFFASGRFFIPFFTIGTTDPDPHLEQWGDKAVLVEGVNKAGMNYHAVFLVEGAERTPVCVAVFEQGKDGEWKPRERNAGNW